MKLPNKLKILGFNYTIDYLDTSKKMIDAVSGAHRQSDLKIFIDDTNHREYQESTLIHEIIESIDESNELGLEHQTISILEAGIYQTFKDNDMFNEKHLEMLAVLSLREGNISRGKFAEILSIDRSCVDDFIKGYEKKMKEKAFKGE